MWQSYFFFSLSQLLQSSFYGLDKSKLYNLESFLFSLSHTLDGATRLDLIANHTAVNCINLTTKKTGSRLLKQTQERAERAREDVARLLIGRKVSAAVSPLATRLRSRDFDWAETLKTFLSSFN